MESTSNTSSTAQTDQFVDAPDEFPFYDCVDTADELYQSISGSSSSSISNIEPTNLDDDASLHTKPSPEIPTPSNLRRRRLLLPFTHEDADFKGSKTADSSVSSEDFAISTERQYLFSRNFKGNDKSDLVKARFGDRNPNAGLREEDKETSAITTATNDSADNSTTVESSSTEMEERSSNYVFVLAALVIKAIGLQLNLLISFVTLPIWLMYSSYMFLMDPLHAMRCFKEFLKQKWWRIWSGMWETVMPFVYEWLKGQKSVWKMALRLVWGLLWSIYVCFVLGFLLILAFVVSGLIVRILVERPIQKKEVLEFDYTKSSPDAYVPLGSCHDVSRCVNLGDKIDVGKLGGAHIIPPDHKLQATVSLTLPESDYNRNLGMFQVRVDLLSANGKPLASKSHPCMLHFRSEPLRFLLTFLKIAPLITGYSSESQTLDVKFRGFTEGGIPTACLRVKIEQRAEYQPGGGIPEIYAASLTLESELPLLKRILWCWKTTIFIWLSLIIFTMEFLFALLCCKPVILPRMKMRDGSAPGGGASHSNSSVQR